MKRSIRWSWWICSFVWEALLVYSLLKSLNLEKASLHTSLRKPSFHKRLFVKPPLDFQGSCRLQEISQTWACNEFLAYSTPHVEILNLISLCQRKSSLWFHRAFPFWGTIRMFRKNEVRPKRGTCPDMVWEARHPGPFGARVASTSNETASYEQSKDMQRPSATNASLPWGPQNMTFSTSRFFLAYGEYRMLCL